MSREVERNYLAGISLYGVESLAGPDEEVPLPIPADLSHPEITIEGSGQLGDTDRHLLRYLFRDARSVKL